MPAIKDADGNSVELFTSLDDAIKNEFPEFYYGFPDLRPETVSLVIAEDQHGKIWFATALPCLCAALGRECEWERLRDWESWYKKEWIARIKV